MKSAYVVLGVPGNVGAEELQAAYATAMAHFTKERLAENPSLLGSWNEVKEAYKVLSNADLRKAHDRKLNGSATPSVRVVTVPAKQESSASSALKWAALVVVAMFAIGTYFSHVREEARKDKVARELALKKEEQEQALQAARDSAAADAERARTNAVAENNERRLRSESSAIARQAQAIDAMQQAALLRQEQTAKNNARMDERQRTMEAQQRAADDQRRIRNLCMLNYGRPNC